MTAAPYEQQVVVRGQAEVQAPADVADLTVQVRLDAPGQADAFAGAGALATGVDAVLDHHAGALGDRQQASVVVRPTTRWHEGEQQATGWRAERTSSVEVTDLGALGSLLADLVATGAMVDGPRWRLRAGHPALAEARAAAAEDARARAAAYAGALGIDLGRVVWVAEPGLRGGAGGAEPGVARRMRLASAASDDAMEVPPAEVVVQAEVEVGFALGR